ncbi:MAG: crotonase/enoyl-CoA hydratase family protein [Labilithrix sp.]|nr:crotonase/enoyl-CoA hydratase family protein [Labilithrix sp.]MCW5815607.1 crotonase/enoyl-CoA hydratase family protein [Labilithrix sp.]
MERITYEARESGVALIGLNRAAKRNAFDLLMLDELAEAYTRFDDDASLRCAVVFAHGDHFTAGLDLAEVGPAVASGRALFPAGSVDPLGLGPRRAAKPIVTAIQGYCYTIGIELALATEVRFAADDAKLAQLEVKRGIFPFGGATLRMPAVAGYGNAMKHLLTGDVFDANEALRAGIVQEVVPRAELLARATAYAERVAAQAPLAVRATIASVRGALADGEAAEALRLLDRARALMTSEDAMEGMQSFLERRDAKFTGT